MQWLYLNTSASELVPFILYSLLLIPFSSPTENFQGALKDFPCQTKNTQHTVFPYKIPYKSRVQRKFSGQSGRANL